MEGKDANNKKKDFWYKFNLMAMPMNSLSTHHNTVIKKSTKHDIFKCIRNWKHYLETIIVMPFSFTLIDRKFSKPLSAFLLRLYFFRTINFHRKLERSTGTSFIPCLHRCIESSIKNIPHKRGIFVATDEPTLTF